MKNSKVKAIAVSNFLCSMHGLTYHEAMGNLELDAQMYKWNSATVSAIRSGILLGL